MFSPRLDWALSPLLDWPATSRSSGSGGRLDSARLAEPSWLDSARLSGARRSGFLAGGGSRFIADAAATTAGGGGGLMEVRMGVRAGVVLARVPHRNKLALILFAIRCCCRSPTDPFSLKACRQRLLRPASSTSPPPPGPPSPKPLDRWAPPPDTAANAAAAVAESAGRLLRGLRDSLGEAAAPPLALKSSSLPSKAGGGGGGSGRRWSGGGADLLVGMECAALRALVGGQAPSPLLGPFAPSE